MQVDANANKQNNNNNNNNNNNVHKVNGAFTWRIALEPGWNFLVFDPGQLSSCKRSPLLSIVQTFNPGWTRPGLKFLMYTQPSSCVLVAYVSCARDVRLYDFSISTRVKRNAACERVFMTGCNLTLVELDPGWNLSCKPGSTNYSLM